MPAPIDRRVFLKAVVFAGGLSLQQIAGAGRLWAGKQLASRPASPESPAPDSIFSQAEESTRLLLRDIEQRLRTTLEQRDEPFSDVVRLWCIQLSMLPVVSGVASDLLEMLGENVTARQGLFFLMPFVRWMSEPFLFPLETQGTPEQRALEMDKLFALMARLRRQGLTASLDNVGDASLSPAAAKAYQEYYLTLLRAFLASDGAAELNVSVKLSALVHNLEVALGHGTAAESKCREIVDALETFLKIASQAPDRNIFVRIDMEEYAYKDLTLGLFRRVVEHNPAVTVDASGRLRLGVVIQAYLREAARDVRDLADWARSRGLRAPIRLVKGAYLEFERQAAATKGYPSPVWDNKSSTDANYEAVSACLLLNLDAVDPAFATHNIRSQAHAMALARAYGLPPEAAPIQMLYGMGDPIKHVIASMRRPLREYVPAGSLARGLKYAGRRFAELASSDNALAKTMRGDFSEVDAATPIFAGKRDVQDALGVKAILEQALANKPRN